MNCEQPKVEAVCVAGAAKLKRALAVNNHQIKTELLAARNSA
jgi:hypothetical protein